MKKNDIRTFTAALLSLTAVSCSPIVAEYQYEGNVYGAGGGSARTLILKEYKDGKVAGQLRSGGATNPYTCGSVGGKIQGRSLTLYRSNLGSSYMAASMAAGSAIATYNGTLSKSKRSLKGSWRSSNRFKSGSFDFRLTYLNGERIRYSSGGGTQGDPPGEGGIHIESDAPTGSEGTGISF